MYSSQKQGDIGDSDRHSWMASKGIRLASTYLGLGLITLFHRLEYKWAQQPLPDYLDFILYV